MKRGTCIAENHFLFLLDVFCVGEVCLRTVLYLNVYAWAGSSDDRTRESKQGGESRQLKITCPGPPRLAKTHCS